MNRTLRAALVTLVALALLAAPRVARAEHLRDLTDVAGARENQLVGYGIVTGLQGTGDDASAPFAAQSILALLRRLGVQIDSPQVRLKNVAAVIVTATLPPFAKTGTKIDVTVSSIGNSQSLAGGTLVQTLLKGPDQHTYAVAQGGVVVGGMEAKGASGSGVKQGSTVVARVPEGALVEREVPATIVTSGSIKLELRSPGFATAARIAEAVNAKFPGAAAALDGGAVSVKLPQGFETKVVEFVAEVEDLEVSPVRRARVVINERNGTIVAGGDVRLAPSAVVHGPLTIVVKESPKVSQPKAPVAGGRTVVAPRSEVSPSEPQKPVYYMPEAPSLADVATALGTLGLTAREMASVLQAMRTAGALEAEVVIQ